MTEPVIASMTLVLICRDEHGTIIHSEEVQEVQESTPPAALEELEQESRLMRARIERFERELSDAVGVEREACAVIAQFNQANHLEHLTAEQIRARGVA